MKDYIAFFSSDFRPLYKTDIYNACCLPKNYVIQFRYQSKYISSDIINLISSNDIANRRGVIFFTIVDRNTDGDVTKDVNGKMSIRDNISIREVEIVSVEKNNDTGIIHFYLSLKDFKDYKIPHIVTNIPPDYYVANIELTTGEENSWYQRVDAIKNEFSNQMFVKSEIVEKKCNNDVYPVFENSEKHSIYKLHDAKEYVLDLSIYDLAQPASGQANSDKNLLYISEKSNQLEINCPESIDIGTVKDNRRYRLVTRYLKDKKADAFLNVAIKTRNGKEFTDRYSYMLTLQIERDKNKSLFFAIYTFGAAASTALIAGFTLSIRNCTPNFWYLIVGVPISIFCVYQLYNSFSKK